jgi:hypothetical protein
MEIPYEREIANYEEYYRFKYNEGTVDIWDCAGLPVDEVRAVANEYAKWSNRARPSRGTTVRSSGVAAFLRLRPASPRVAQPLRED